MIYFEVMVSDSFSAANTTLLEIEVNALIFWKFFFWYATDNEGQTKTKSRIAYHFSPIVENEKLASD